MRVGSVLWLAVAMCRLFTANAHAAAWTLEDGKWQVITTLTSTRADRAFDNTGQPVERPNFEKYSARMLIEYGMTDWLTVLAEPGYERVEVEFSPTQQSAQGFNSTGFGTRFRVLKYKNYVASLQATLYAPGQLRTTQTTVLSFGSFDADLRILIGNSRVLKFLSLEVPVFWDAQMGYRWRSKEPADEYHADLTTGVQILDRVQLLGQTFNIVGVRGQSDTDRTVFPPFYLSKGQVSGVYKLSDKMSVQLGGFRALAGRNIIEEEGVFTALWLRF